MEHISDFNKVYFSREGFAGGTRSDQTRTTYTVITNIFSLHSLYYYYYYLI